MTDDEGEFGLEGGDCNFFLNVILALGLMEGEREEKKKKKPRLAAVKDLHGFQSGFGGVKEEGLNNDCEEEKLP